MSHARATVAGVLAVGIVLLLVSEGPLREPERAFAAFIGLLAVVGLLVGIDSVAVWRGKDRRDDDDDQT